jgi:6-phosphogluconolactonase
VRIFPNPEELVAAAASEIARCRTESIRARGVFSLALSGGTTPRALHARLAQDHPEADFWEKVQLFFGDERSVPPDRPESNYRMAEETLFTKAEIPAENIHRMKAELPPQEAADEYERELRSWFGTGAGEFPRFDLILLGMGPDGHTASLFPGTEALKESSRLVVANWVPRLNTWRISLSFPVLNCAREVIFLVTGENKAPVIAQILGDAPSSETFPAQSVSPQQGRLIWMLDKAAAAGLKSA